MASITPGTRSGPLLTSIYNAQHDLDPAYPSYLTSFLLPLASFTPITLPFLLVLFQTSEPSYLLFPLPYRHFPCSSNYSGTVYMSDTFPDHAVYVRSPSHHLTILRYHPTQPLSFHGTDHHSRRGNVPVTLEGRDLSSPWNGRT